MFCVFSRLRLLCARWLHGDTLPKCIRLVVKLATKLRPRWTMASTMASKLCGRTAQEGFPDPFQEGEATTTSPANNVREVALEKAEIEAEAEARIEAGIDSDADEAVRSVRFQIASSSVTKEPEVPQAAAEELEKRLMIKLEEKI
eukprot:TRINITY_DN83117_c0_g1_i1.p2 TRINITY_DN83117_c0_g1~~TRINITY_DN83117_c0_g1_i1.p2  ORF type:complete len:145 (-),score=21.04 TRINITY_DN83117_c0_g1_i1:379-813(-)